jgi:HEAT repeat protein
LLKALEHQNSYVRRSAAAALGELGSEAAIPGLLQALEHQNSYVRRIAAEALGKLGSEAAIPGLLKALEDQNSYVRRIAAAALGELGSEAAIPGSLKALEHQNSDVRRIAVGLLGELRTTQVVIPLIRVLKYRGADLRAEAAEALGKVGKTLSSLFDLALIVSTLIDALHDKYKSVRNKAAIALAEIGEPRSLSQLWQKQLNSNHLEIYQAISGIQNRCQFYNYDLTQLPLPADQPLTMQNQLQKNLQRLYDQLAGKENALVTAPPEDKVRIRQQIEDLKAEIQTLEATRQQPSNPSQPSPEPTPLRETTPTPTDPSLNPSHSLKKARLQQELAQCEAEHHLVNEQFLAELNAATRNRLKRQLEQLETQMDKISQELNTLIS